MSASATDRSEGDRVGAHSCPPPDQVRGLLMEWLGWCGLGATATDHGAAYRSFEEIHPFRDGNGRVGKIVYNWLRGSLNAPAMPPNFWGIGNP